MCGISFGHSEIVSISFPTSERDPPSSLLSIEILFLALQVSPLCCKPPAMHRHDGAPHFVLQTDIPTSTTSSPYPLFPHSSIFPTFRSSSDLPSQPNAM